MSRGQLPARDTASRAPIGLDADAILGRALELLDEAGVDGFAIRVLADRLGVRAPTIYWHVGSKATLLQSLVDRVVGEMAALAESTGSWEARLRHFVSNARERLLAHPGVLELLRTVHTQAFEQWIVVAFGIMADAGLDEHEAAVFSRIAMAHALSTAQMELATRTTPYLEPVGAKRRRYRVRREALRPGLDPHVYAMTSFDLDEQHSTHDDIFVAGVREVSRRARPKRR